MGRAGEGGVDALTITLTLPPGIGVGARTAPTAGLADPEQLRFWLGRVWMDATGDYLRRRRPAWREPILDTAEG